MLLTFLIALPLLAACFIALLESKHRRIIEWAVMATGLVELGLALALVPVVVAQGKVEASALFSLDALGVFVSLLIALVGCFASFSTNLCEGR